MSRRSTAERWRTTSGRSTSLRCDFCISGR
jgi:hypothetical protein